MAKRASPPAPNDCVSSSTPYTTASVNTRKGTANGRAKLNVQPRPRIRLGDNHALIRAAEVEDAELPVVRVAAEMVECVAAHDDALS